MLTEHQKQTRRDYNKTPAGRAGIAAYKKRVRERDPVAYKRRSMAEAARTRARKGNYPGGSLLESDIQTPTHCPALGMELGWDNRTVQDNSPTLDKLVPSLGYVPGNIQVISHKANNIKHNANAEEIRAVAAWLDTILKG